ncbi:integral membrane sensor signal transduction histidine kinase [Tepidicaulis marinus]|uniref:histidine kinase n=1 Tax=Tepidicaulis marinus TaxID=1333998 RepID=A0A081BAT8_9HYPH|nr:ATP-binding protein [Tepidicaulis marinus]GAK45156.1 integral membrane sensor signal transduction histidine kinase [Tepidicaulis marinus]
MRLDLNSLSFRLIAAATVWIGLFLLLAGIGLTSLFRQSVERSFDSNLEVMLDGLVAVAEISPEGRISLQRTPAETRFDRAYSGWYWQITPLDSAAVIEAVEENEGPDSEVMRSRSLWDITLPLKRLAALEEDDEGGLRRGYMAGPQDQRLRVLERRLALPENPRVISFALAADTSSIDAEVAQFNGFVIGGLFMLGGGLVIALVIQVRFGLRPLENVRTALRDIRTGRQTRLHGDFPAEIKPLADELNSLLDYTTDVLERSRTHVGNLAHALKTPLSVLTNESRRSQGALAGLVEREAAAMREQIDHHLSRARAAASVRVLGAFTPLEPLIERMERTLARIYLDKNLLIEAECEAGLAFRGEAQDMEELIGNLLDNACKWAARRVRIHASGAAGDGDTLTLCVDDDGPGLSGEEREKALGRGQRLDERKPGSGLGLSIVKDIAALYNGAFTLEESPLGGLRARLVLPRAKAES